MLNNTEYCKHTQFHEDREKYSPWIRL